MRCVLAVALALATACARSPSAPPPASAPIAPPVPAAPEGALDPLLTTYDYPYPVGFHSFDSQGQHLRMAYLDVAPTTAPNGRTVLLLHGKNFSAAYWAMTIQLLTEAGFRVIAPDQVGFGKSDKPDRYQFSFEALVANTRSLLDDLEIDRVRVVGHSMGGMLATRFALMMPERSERLVLVNPIGLEDYREHVPAATIDELYAQELRATPESIREYMTSAYFAGEWRSSYEPLVEILAGWTLHPEYPKVAWNAALTADMIYTQPVVQDLRRITVPTLLIIGQRDRTAIGKDRAPDEVAARLGNYPALSRQTAALIPGAKLVALAGIGHLPQVEAFNAYSAALLDFLR